jgi:hypothetical protein
VFDLEKIHIKFAELIAKHGIHRTLGVPASTVRNYRYYLKKGQRISLELKIRCLQKAGVPVMDDAGEFSKEDLRSLVKFVYREKVEHEPAYAVEKFLVIEKNKKANFIQPSLF